MDSQKSTPQLKQPPVLYLPINIYFTHVKWLQWNPRKRAPVKRVQTVIWTSFEYPGKG